MIAKQKSNTPSNDTNSSVPYKHTPTDNFLFVIVIPTSDKMVNSYKITISDFNTKYYSSSTFEPIKSVTINSQTQLITVKKFKGVDTAIDYYKSFNLNKDNLKTLNEKKYDSFLISEKNFVLFYQDKNVANYLAFFSKNFDIE